MNGIINYLLTWIQFKRDKNAGFCEQLHTNIMKEITLFCIMKE